MKNKNQPAIIEIDNCLVSSEIITECFSCDYEKCKGICCIIGDSGAPVTEQECEELERHYAAYSSLMTEKGRSKIAEAGFFNIDSDGDIVTPLVGDKGECAYAAFENGNCFCSVERSHCNGHCEFVKPISCRLYPIRVSTLSNGMKALNLHRWHLCRDAFEKGRKEKLPVYQFLRESIIFQFGEEFYSLLEEAARIFNAES